MACKIFSCRHLGSNSLTRDQTQAPCIGNSVLTSGPPGKTQTALPIGTLLWFWPLAQDFDRSLWRLGRGPLEGADCHGLDQASPGPQPGALDQIAKPRLVLVCWCSFPKKLLGSLQTSASAPGPPAALDRPAPWGDDHARAGYHLMLAWWSSILEPASRAPKFN